MNNYYAKTLLYAYPNLISLTEQIDELVEKKAFASMGIFSPALFQCEQILGLTNQKQIIINVKIILDKVLEKFSLDELDCFSYKYFKNKPKEYFKNFDASSRGYFRKQIKLINLFSKRLEYCGIDDDWFIKNCLNIDFFKELYKRVLEYEKITNKRKTFSAKTIENNVKMPKKTKVKIA
ncbi:MAG: hypothetical protein IKW33_01640 [Clostridia bacterium]|nr:hypothetical protein [Clostridia bacterium]